MSNKPFFSDNGLNIANLLYSNGNFLGVGTSTPNNTITANGNILAVGNITAQQQFFSNTITTNTITSNTISANSSTLTYVVSSNTNSNTLTTNNIFVGNSTVNVQITFSGISLNGYVNAVGAIVTSNTISVTGATTLSNTLSVTGAATFSNTISSNGSITSTIGNISSINSAGSAYIYAIGSGGSFISTRDTAATVDNKCYELLNSGGTLVFRITNDAYNVANNWLTVTRSGTSVSGVNFPTSTVNFQNTPTIGGTALSSLYPLSSSSPLFTNGGLTVQSTTAASSITINAKAGSQATIFLQDGGVNKWQFGKQTDNSFFMWDSANARNAFVISTADVVDFAFAPTIGGTALSTLYPLLSGSPTFMGGIVASRSTSGWAQFVANKGGSGQASSIYGQNNGLNRWSIRLGAEDAETGSNAGSNFYISRYNDAGTGIGDSFFINRATGDTYIYGRLFVGNGADQSVEVSSSTGTAWFIGNGPGGLTLHNLGNGDTIFTTNGLEKMRLYNSGQGLVLNAVRAGSYEDISVYNGSTTTGTQARWLLGTGLANAYALGYVNQDSTTVASFHFSVGAGITGGIQFESPVKFNSTVSGLPGYVLTDNGAGAVGSFTCAFSSVLATNATPGTTIAGSSILVYNNNYATTTAQTGTWRFLGAVTNGGQFGFYQRIA